MASTLRSFVRLPLVAAMARTLDMFGALNQPLPYESLSPREADTKAMRDDWAAVGQDLTTAMQQLDEELAAGSNA